MKTLFPGFHTHKMQRRTVDLSEQLFSAQWFHSIGQPLDAGVYQVESWGEAVDYCEDTDQAFLEAGDYTVQLRRKAPKEFRRWNDVVVAVKRLVVARVDERVEALRLSKEHEVKVRDRARWTIVSACVEAEYLDVIPAGFFLPLSDWYIKGRFPCGWRGKYPEGQLAVF
mgnify:FL=1